MNLKHAMKGLVKRNKQFFLDSVHDGSDFDEKYLKDYIESEEEYRQDMIEALYIMKKTGLCMFLYDIIDSIEIMEVPLGEKKILLRLVKEHGRIKVMRKMANEIKRLEGAMAARCKEICRTRNITAEEAADMIQKIFDRRPKITFSQPDESGHRAFMGMISSPTGRIISF